VTTIYTVVGQHRTVPGLLLLLGDDNRYYSYARNGQLERVKLTCAWALDADREAGNHATPTETTSVSASATPDRTAHSAISWHLMAARGASRWRPLRTAAVAMALFFGAMLSGPVAFAHSAALETTTADIALYEDPSTDAPVLAELPAGTEIELTGAAEGDFLEATFDGLRGWTRVDKLDGNFDTAPVVLDASLRAAPNEEGAILGAVQAGSTVILTGASVDGYLAASFDGTGGWLPASAVA